MKFNKLCFFAFILMGHCLLAKKKVETISMNFSGNLPKVFMNNKQILCHCGKLPEKIIFLNGKFYAACSDHLADIECD